MIIKIKTIPNAKKEKIIKTDTGFKIYLTQIPEDGKANKALLKALAEHLHTAKSNISIIKGEKSREKVIEII